MPRNEEAGAQGLQAWAKGEALLNGMDLFSGTGGIGFALSPWVRTIAYCENNPHSQGTLMSRMYAGDIDLAPIWDDVRTLRPEHIKSPIDIISGGFPCQDLSVAGTGAGLGGERSGLVFELFRLVGEFRPRFVFLENVPALAVRGLDRLLLELHALRYDARWTIVSAAEMGAPHLRERIWILAHAHGQRRREGVSKQAVWRQDPDTECSGSHVDNALRGRYGPSQGEICARGDGPFDPSWWKVEPDVGRVAHGIPNRAERLRGLGNAVVPQAAREAFKRLMGL